MDEQGALGIIHNPASIGQDSGNMEMRHFLNTYSSRNPVPWEDKDKEPDYDQWKGKFPPFKIIENLGKSQTATIDKVRSLNSGIVMARKLINCEPSKVQKLASTEINCLNGLRHPHIVSFVGAYLEGNSVGILLYPAAEWNLEQFMVDVPNIWGEAQRHRLRRYFVCLAQAVSYLHKLNIRHKDIKPTNILVDTFGNVLLADFGISLRAQDKAHLITQTNTNRSYEYCSPEVIARRKRHPSSDVFSLGAVFAEMTTVVLNRTLIDFRTYRKSRGGDKSFHRNLVNVGKWMEIISQPFDKQDEMVKVIPTILSMLAYKRDAPPGTDSGIDRPSVSSLWDSFQHVSSYICQDCDPRHSSSWKHEPPPEGEHNLGRLGYFEDSSRESLRETKATIGNTDSHAGRQGPDQRKTEILYDPHTLTLKMVTKAEIEGNLVLLIGFPTSQLQIPLTCRITLLASNVIKEDLPATGDEIYINRGDDTYDKIILRGLGMKVKVKRLFRVIKYIYILRGREDLNFINE